MKLEVKSVIALAEKLAGKKIPGQLSVLKLHDIEKNHSFKQFLINNRVIPLLTLKLLFEHGLKSTCVVGYEKVTYISETESEDEIAEQEPFGPSIIKGTFSGEEVFNMILDEFGIITIQAGKAVPVSSATYVNTSGIHPPRPIEAWYRSCEERVIIVFDPVMIFTGNLIYVSEKIRDDVSRLLAYNKKTFDEFLKNSDNTTVNHEIYIDLLLKWFPGMIHIRSIGYAGHP